MTFLPNKTAWRAWAKEIEKGQPQKSIDAPDSFPCYGYTVVGSYNYEEEAARYLFPEDVARMVTELLTK